MRTSVGVDRIRPDGPDKVSGRATYIADLAVPGAWIGGTVRSHIAHGILRGFDRDPSFDWSRVVVVGPERIPGDNVQALIEDDQPILGHGEVRHVGEPLLLVAAPDLATLERALASIRPRIDALPPELDFERSAHVVKELRIEKGDVDACFARPRTEWRQLDGTYRTASQEQLYIEPQGCIAWPLERDGTLVVRGSLQCPHYVRKALARCFGIALEQARVIQMETGGGFGGKEEYPSVVACHAALLAHACGHPVRLIYDRHEDLAFTPKRHPSRVTHRTLVDADGGLIAMDIEVLLDAGAYTTLSPVVLSRGCIHAAGPYRCENVRIVGRALATHHVPYGAFRGFGAPQTCFAIERQMDRIARALHIHPYELRRRNALRRGDTTATGQRLDDSAAAFEVLDAIARTSGIDRHPWCERASRPIMHDRRAVVRGVGLSFFFHGAGFTGSGELALKGRVSLSLAGDGRVEVLAGSTEIGQGTRALFRTIAITTLRAEEDDVVLAEPDTARVPDSGPTVASRTCMVVGAVLARACNELVAKVGGDATRPWRERALAAARREGEVRVTASYEPPRGLAWDDERYVGDAYPTYGWAADVAEVEVDVDTLEVRIVKLWTAVDVGKAIQPRLVRGQIEGGALQALGWSHLEVVTTKAGRFEQDRLATCIIPTSLDAPEFEVELIEVPYAHGPFGAKGVGELPMDGGAPAVCAAIEDALGIHVERIPATPESLLVATRASSSADEMRA